MPNPYRDEWERFATADEMRAAINRQLDAGDFDKAMQLTAALREAVNAGAFKKEREELAASVAAEQVKKQLSPEEEKFIQLQESMRKSGRSLTRTGIDGILKRKDLSQEQKQALAAEFGTQYDVVDHVVADPAGMWKNHEGRIRDVVQKFKWFHKAQDKFTLNLLADSLAQGAQSSEDLQYAMDTIQYDVDFPRAVKTVAGSEHLTPSQAVQVLRSSLEKSPNPNAVRLTAGALSQNESYSGITELWKGNPEGSYLARGGLPTAEDEDILNDYPESHPLWKAAAVRADSTSSMQQGLQADLAVAEQHDDDWAKEAAASIRQRLSASQTYLYHHHQIDKFAASLSVKET